ncbi:MAG: hypothetical protein IH946_08535 [Bacteroidetes bacterium]|nr:hypothetical protein [Bacteroidota bacterium]
MINPFKEGDVKEFTITVSEKDIATFPTGEVHPVYATFALTRDAEWACRLFVLEMKESHEEGIGTSISVEHVSPAMVGSEVVFKARLDSVTGYEIICSFKAFVVERLIATGTTVQKILTKEKFDRLFSEL